MQTFTKIGKRDEVADEIERGDHDAPGDQSQLDLVRAYIASEVRLAATPQHDVYVSVSGHNRDEGIDPDRQYRHIVIEIRASPDPTATSSALGLDNKQLNVPGLTTETLRAAETIRTNTPNLAEGPDPGTKVVGGPRQGSATGLDAKAADIDATGLASGAAGEETGAAALVALATKEQQQGQTKTQNMLTDGNLNKTDEQRKEDEREANKPLTTTTPEVVTTTPSETLTTTPENVVTTTPETVTETEERKL